MAAPPPTVNIPPWTTVNAFHDQLWMPRGRRPLPSVPNCDGRPIWEPPCLDYSFSINKEVYEKKRNALLKYFHGDIVKVTEVMDIMAELDILDNYYRWVQKNLETTKDSESYEFFGDLYRRLADDQTEMWAMYTEFDIILTIRDDSEGNYVMAFKFRDWKAMEAEEAEEQRAMEAEFVKERKELELQAQPLAMRLVALRRCSESSSHSDSSEKAPHGSDLD